jgi:hypothetical protein
MKTAEHSPSLLPKLLLAGVASATLAIGAAGIAAAATDTTGPGEGATEHTEHAAPPASLAVDGSAEASSPEADALCAGVFATSAAMDSGDEAAIGEAVEGVTAAAAALPDAAPLVEAVLANAQDPESPEFAEAYGALIEWMKGNCGYAEIDVTASEYQFEGVPAEVPAGPAIISLENAGEQVHEFALMRINDDVTLSLEELLALPEEESETMVTSAAFAFTFPGTVGYATADLTPGRYVALCFLPEGATPEVLMQLEELGLDGPDATLPAGDTLPPELQVGPPHFTKGMVHEFTVV